MTAAAERAGTARVVGAFATTDPTVAGPHVRLGLAWAGATLLFAAMGTWALATWLALAGGLAAVQACRSWQGAARPSPVAAGAAVVVIVLGAASGLVGATVGVGVAVVAAAAASSRLLPRARSEPVRRSPRARRLAAVIAAAVALPCASVVLLRRVGTVQVLVLLTLVAVYDASSYVVGSGALNPWEGPAAGVASIAAVSLAVAAVLVPPFRGASPWLLGAVAAVLAPIGPRLASGLVGTRRSPVQALRRLDSLMVLAPVWTVLAWRLAR
jgi:hypothetical protein